MGAAQEYPIGLDIKAVKQTRKYYAVPVEKALIEIPDIDRLMMIVRVDQTKAKNILEPEEFNSLMRHKELERSVDALVFKYDSHPND